MSKDYYIHPCASTRGEEQIYTPKIIKREDAREFYLHKKNEILQDCIENPSKYLEEVS